MFALDSLVRSAVHASIAIVSPGIDIDPHPQSFKPPRMKTSTVDSTNTKTSSSSHDKGK